MLEHPLRDWLRSSPGPSETARVLGKAIPLRRLESRSPHSSWWHFDGEERLGSLPLAASVGSALLLEAGEHPQHWLLLQHDGSAVLEQGRRSQELRNGDGAILPGQPWTLHTQESSCSWLSFDPLQLLAAARRLGGPRWQAPSPRQSPLRWARFLRGPQDSSMKVLLETLNLLLINSHRVNHLRPELLENLLLEQQLYRWLALLLFEDLRDGHNGHNGPNGHDGHSPGAGANDPRLESLIDFISLHLDQPLTLQRLEQQSNYSRRTLHYLFHQRFGCSPMQWIRQLRMAQALERLSNPIPGDSVKSVAAECGYRSLSQFGLDFQRAHNRRPSEALRAGRSSVA
jgi:AraC-like DNA-binding protein